MSDKNYKTIEMSSEQFVEMHEKVVNALGIAFKDDILVLRCDFEVRDKVVKAIQESQNCPVGINVIRESRRYCVIVVTASLMSVQKLKFGDDLPPNLIMALNEVLEADDLIDEHAMGFSENGILTFSTLDREQSLKLMKHLAAYLGTHIKSIKAKMFDDNSCAFKVRFVDAKLTVNDVIDQFRLKEVLRPK
jgi:hypothetical protein